MPTREIPLHYRGWKGVNLSAPATAIQDNELSRCENFDVGYAGELIKRPGWRRVHAFTDIVAGRPQPTRLLGRFKTDTYDQLIAHAAHPTAIGAFRYSTNGTTWSTIQGGGDDMTESAFGIQYANKFYFGYWGMAMVSWDGATATSPVGMPFISGGRVHKERLFAWRSKGGTTPSRLLFSAVGNFESWPSTNFIDVNPGDGDVIVGAAVLYDILIIFKMHTTWALYVSGDPTGWTLRSLNPNLGCVSQHSIVNYQGYLFFSSADGVYRTDGTTFQKVSSAIDPDIKGREIGRNLLNLDHAAVWEDRIIFLFRPTLTTYCYYVYYPLVDSWTRWILTGNSQPFYFVPIRGDNASLTKGIWAGDMATTGRVFRFDPTIFQDDTVTYSAIAKTKEYTLDNESSLKRGKWGTIEVSSISSGAASWFTDEVERVITDPVPSGAGLTGSPATGMYSSKIPGPGYFRKCALEYRHTNADAATLLGFSLYLHDKRPQIASRR